MSTVHNDLSIYQSAALTAPTGEGEHAEEQGSLQGCLAALYCWHLGRTADLIAPAGEGEPAQEQGTLQGCLAALYIYLSIYLSTQSISRCPHLIAPAWDGESAQEQEIEAGH